MFLYSSASAAASLLALAQPSAPATASPAAPIGKFTDLPNVTVTHYDVTGGNVRALHRSIEAQAPRDPATNKPVPAQSDWLIQTAVDTNTTGGRCRIAGVRLRFAGTARMPRLVPSAGAEPIPPGLLAVWQLYTAQLESRQVDQLRFAYDRLTRIEQEIRASSCANWKGTASASIARLKLEQAEMRSRDTAPAPRLDIPKKELDDEGVKAVQLPGGLGRGPPSNAGYGGSGWL